MQTTSHLLAIKRQLELRRKKAKRESYAIPSLWGGGSPSARRKPAAAVEPCGYFIRAIDRILRQKRQQCHDGEGGSWTSLATIYNMFVRTTAAFDHNRNGRLDLPVNEQGWRETGSFLKAIALLPYIRSLGADTIHLLPITAIGHDGNKGTLGSPYAIRNPYALDEQLGEPNLGMKVEEQFAAFVEGAHHLGMRVVVEFVFRTSAKDGDWVQEHPEWFYWIDAAVKDRGPGEHDESKYGNPHFTQEELSRIVSAVERRAFDGLLPPHEGYRKMFTPPPSPEEVLKVGGRWIGRLPDGTRVRIPGAFADWPPDDAQPPWGDVTYLKMYDHPEFNYIAYNTIRMYDSRLARPEHASGGLWRKVAEIIPYYQHTFGIDGVMIDMGHALPMALKQEMIRRARSIDPAFAFWDENFSVEPQSVKDGYNAVIGYQWCDQHHPARFKSMLRRCANEGFPLPFFATPESHNTPRAATRPGGVRYSCYAWAVGSFLPAIPFIHSGFEVGETYPVNTGLDFSREELRRYPSERLPLFSEHALPWGAREEFTSWIRTVASLRRRFQALIVDPAPRSFLLLEPDRPEILAFVRRSDEARTALLVVANTDMAKPVSFRLACETKKRVLADLLGKKTFRAGRSGFRGRLEAGGVAVCTL